LHLCTLLFLQCKTPKNAKSSKFFFRSTSWHRTALNKTVVIAATKRCQTSTTKNACLSSTHCFWHLLTCILCMVWHHVCFCNSVNSPTHDVLMPLSYLSLGNQNKKMCGTISNATSILTRDLQKMIRDRRRQLKKRISTFCQMQIDFQVLMMRHRE
jgi:hypothetical protein